MLSVKILFLSLLAFIMAGCDAKYEQLYAGITKCDELAASPYDADKTAINGVETKDIMKVDALKACDKSVKDYPEESRFYFQLARVYYAMGDHKLAFEFASKASSKGYIAAKTMLAYLYSVGEGVEKDNVKAFEFFKKAADLGLADSQNSVGQYYEYGNGVEKNTQKAIEYYTKSSEQGDARGQLLLGLMYDNGNGIEKDKTKAVELYLKSANQGYSEAQHFLGISYENGDGVEKDHAKAVEWYKKAADQGHVDSIVNLGAKYLNGDGIEEDQTKAFELFKEAEKQGNSMAMYNLGMMYMVGSGVDKNSNIGLRYIQSAADNGQRQALNYMKEYKAILAEANKEYIINNTTLGLCDTLDSSYIVFKAIETDYYAPVAPLMKLGKCIVMPKGKYMPVKITDTKVKDGVAFAKVKNSNGMEMWAIKATVWEKE